MDSRSHREIQREAARIAEATSPPGRLRAAAYWRAYAVLRGDEPKSTWAPPWTGTRTAHAFPQPVSPSTLERRWGRATAAGAERWAAASGRHVEAELHARAAVADMAPGPVRGAAYHRAVDAATKERPRQEPAEVCSPALPFGPLRRRLRLRLGLV